MNILWFGNGIDKTYAWNLGSRRPYDVRSGWVGLIDFPVAAPGAQDDGDRQYENGKAATDRLFIHIAVGSMLP